MRYCLIVMLLLWGCSVGGEGSPDTPGSPDADTDDSTETDFQFDDSFYLGFDSRGEDEDAGAPLFVESVPPIDGSMPAAGGSAPEPPVDAGYDAMAPASDPNTVADNDLAECRADADCDSGICGFLGTVGYCTQVCSVSADCSDLGARCHPDTSVCFIDCGRAPAGSEGVCPGDMVCLSNDVCGYELSCEEDPGCKPCTTDSMCDAIIGCCRPDGSCGLGGSGGCI